MIIDSIRPSLIDCDQENDETYDVIKESSDLATDIESCPVMLEEEFQHQDIYQQVGIIA